MIPGLGRSHGEGNGNPFQYSCLENSMNREAWWATVQGNYQEERIRLVLFFDTSINSIQTLMQIQTSIADLQFKYPRLDVGTWI